jgi:hypothetical protein
VAATLDTNLTAWRLLPGAKVKKQTNIMKRLKPSAKFVLICSAAAALGAAFALDGLGTSPRRNGAAILHPSLDAALTNAALHVVGSVTSNLNVRGYANDQRLDLLVKGGQTNTTCLATNEYFLAANASILQTNNANAKDGLALGAELETRLDVLNLRTVAVVDAERNSVLSTELP